MNNTKGLILVTVIVAAVTTFVRQAGQHKVAFRSYLGASFMGIFLTGIGMVNARLARNFCLLIIFGILLKDGGHIFAFASQASTLKGGGTGGGTYDPGLGGLLTPPVQPPQVAPPATSTPPGSLGGIWTQPGAGVYDPSHPSNATF